MEERHEDHLRGVAGRGQEMVVQMVRTLSSALVYPDAGNVATNEKLWDVYASEWGAEAGWVRDMASGNRNSEELGLGLDCVGDEWAPPAHTERVFAEWLAPLLLRDTTRAAEIGSGGGRIAVMSAPLVRTLSLFDVSAKMLARARAALEARSLSENVEFRHVHGDSADAAAGFSAGERAYPAAARGAFDVVYCFDVMVHMDLHAIWRCLGRIKDLLDPANPDATAFISTSNLSAPQGWARFERQRRYTVGGFYFVTPETVRELAKRAGFKIVRESSPDASNVYYDRDYLALLQLDRPTPPQTPETLNSADPPPVA